MRCVNQIKRKDQDLTRDAFSTHDPSNLKISIQKSVFFWHVQRFVETYKSCLTMNELPVIGYPCLREELWDRQGANIASH